MPKIKIVVASGGFDPLHTGHLAYLSAAKKLGDFLFVGVNSDQWLIRKKGYALLPLEERLAIVGQLKCVDYAMTFADDKLGSASDLLMQLKQQFPMAKLVFVNGGDRNNNNCLEKHIKEVSFEFGVGGSTKLNSSSKIVDIVRKNK